MQHKCGGEMRIISRTKEKIVRECSRCGKILTVYKNEIATSGSPKDKGEVINAR